MITHEEVQAKVDELQALGSPEAIAEFLKGQGIKGRRNSTCFCPVAKYVDPDHRVSFGAETWHVNNSADQTVGGIHIGDVPRHVRDFIFSFDNGRYEDLRSE